MFLCEEGAEEHSLPDVEPGVDAGPVGVEKRGEFLLGALGHELAAALHDLSAQAAVLVEGGVLVEVAVHALDRRTVAHERADPFLEEHEHCVDGQPSRVGAGVLDARQFQQRL